MAKKHINSSVENLLAAFEKADVEYYVYDAMVYVHSTLSPKLTNLAAKLRLESYLVLGEMKCQGCRKLKPSTGFTKINDDQNTSYWLCPQCHQNFQREGWISQTLKVVGSKEQNIDDWDDTEEED